MTLAGLNSKLPKIIQKTFNKMKKTHELLDRFELLYDNIEELKYSRRAVIDED